MCKKLHQSDDKYFKGSDCPIHSYSHWWYVAGNNDVWIYCVCLNLYIFQEDHSRVEIFNGYAKKNKQSVWTPFLNMLNRGDGFIVNQVYHGDFLSRSQLLDLIFRSVVSSPKLLAGAKSWWMATTSNTTWTGSKISWELLFVERATYRFKSLFACVYFRVMSTFKQPADVCKWCYASMSIVTRISTLMGFKRKLFPSGCCM